MKYTLLCIKNVCYYYMSSYIMKYLLSLYVFLYNEIFIVIIQEDV